MRDFKFRVYCGNWSSEPKQRMIYCGSITDPNFYRPESDCEYMQYIGLNDENGRGIYEGDIVNCDNGRYIGVVKFNEDDLSYVIENREGGFGFVNGQIFDERPEYRNYEVIGNIHEHPELLK